MLRLSSPHTMTIFYLIHKHRLNHWLLSNQQELIDSNRRDFNWHDSSDSSRCWCDFNWCDSKLQKFCVQLFNFTIILALSIFDSVVDSKYFTFNFSFTMPWHAPDRAISDPPLMEPEMSKLPHLVLEICGIMLLMVLNGFTLMSSFVFRPKSVLV